MRPSWRIILAAAPLLACLPLRAPGQSDEEQAHRQLQQLRAEIQHINREITAASTRRDKLQTQLRDAEVRLGRIQREIADNRREIAHHEQKLDGLRTERKALEQARDEQRDRIAAELRAAWETGRRGELKVLLNQESPHTVARAMGYYRYFFEARNKLLTRYRGTLLQLREVEQRIDATLQRLARRQQTLEQQQSALVEAQQNRQHAVAELNASIDSRGARLKELERNRRELEQLLQAIREAVVDLQIPDNYQAFRAAKGKMPWPVEGKPSNRFGLPKNEGKMRWQGVTIPAREGTTVRAIHHGRVVYADWFRGSGLLMIIDHGDGYMSLYAHNQSLLREVGEWVTAGTPIGTVGRSGGQEQAGLYFEIRYRGKPTDPGSWCRG